MSKIPTIEDFFESQATFMSANKTLWKSDDDRIYVLFDRLKYNTEKQTLWIKRNGKKTELRYRFKLKNGDLFLDNIETNEDILLDTLHINTGKLIMDLDSTHLPISKIPQQTINLF